MFFLHPVRVLNTRGIAFITYTNEANAQFAKEAMAHQSLDYNEILNVRWATADPNPMAKAREVRRIENQAAEAIRRALPAEFLAELEGGNSELRKRRRVEGSEAPLDDVQAPQGTQDERGDAKMMLEASSGPQPMPWEQEKKEETRDAIFSDRTLAALNTAKVAVTTKSKKPPAPKGVLVGYDSDEDE